jgi:hypothetical protein
MTRVITARLINVKTLFSTADSLIPIIKRTEKYKDERILSLMCFCFGRHYL